MDSLEQYQLEYEEMPLSKIFNRTRKGGKDMKMSKEIKVQEVKAPKAKYAKTRGEHIKDVIIAILIAGVIAFIGGIHFESNKTAEINKAVTAATATPDVKKIAAALATEQQAITPPATPAPQTPEPLKEAPQDCSAVNGYAWDVRVAYAICMAESGGVASKDNAGLNGDGSVDYGLMQVNSIHADLVGGNLELLRNPQINVKVAYQIYIGAKGKFTPWSAYNSGKYLKFL